MSFDDEDLARRKEREQNAVPAMPRWLTWKFWVGAIIMGTIAYAIKHFNGN